MALRLTETHWPAKYLCKLKGTGSTDCKDCVTYSVTVAEYHWYFKYRGKKPNRAQGDILPKQNKVGKPIILLGGI